MKPSAPASGASPVAVGLLGRRRAVQRREQPEVQRRGQQRVPQRPLAADHRVLIGTEARQRAGDEMLQGATGLRAVGRPAARTVLAPGLDLERVELAAHGVVVIVLTRAVRARRVARPRAAARGSRRRSSSARRPAGRRPSAGRAAGAARGRSAPSPAACARRPPAKSSGSVTNRLPGGDLDPGQPAQRAPARRAGGRRAGARGRGARAAVLAQPGGQRPARTKSTAMPRSRRSSAKRRIATSRGAGVRARRACS